MSQTQNLNRSTLLTNERINTSDYLVSPSRTYFAIMQPDGNFCIYRGYCPGEEVRLVWSFLGEPTGRQQRNDYFCILQGDANLCVYQGVATAGTWVASYYHAEGGQPNGNYFVTLQDNGQIVVKAGTPAAPGAQVYALPATAPIVPPPDPRHTTGSLTTEVEAITSALKSYKGVVQLNDVEKLLLTIGKLPDTMWNNVVAQLKHIGVFAEDDFNKLLAHVKGRGQGSVAFRLGNELGSLMQSGHEVVKDIDKFISHELKPDSTFAADLTATLSKLRATLDALAKVYPELIPATHLEKTAATLISLLADLPAMVVAQLEAHIPIPFDTIDSYLDKIGATTAPQPSAQMTEGVFSPEYMRACADLLGYLASICNYFQDTFSKKVSIGARINIGGLLGGKVGWGAAAALMLADKVGVAEEIEVHVGAVDVIAVVPVLLATFFTLGQVGLSAAADWIDVEAVA